MRSTNSPFDFLIVYKTVTHHKKLIFTGKLTVFYSYLVQFNFHPSFALHVQLINTLPPFFV